MKWHIEFHDDFYSEYQDLKLTVQRELLVKVRLLEEFGPSLDRPYVDTLVGSDYTNMKELRFSVGREVWRLAFAFDPERSGILLVAGDKRGKDQKRFYKKLIKTADKRFEDHLETLKRK